MKPKYYIGQSIVCIDDTNQNNNRSAAIIGDEIVANNEYIIRGFASDGGILLAGVIGWYHYNGAEVGFAMRRFEPSRSFKESELWSKNLMEKLCAEITLNEVLKN